MNSQELRIRQNAIKRLEKCREENRRMSLKRPTVEHLEAVPNAVLRAICIDPATNSLRKEALNSPYMKEFEARGLTIYRNKENTMRKNW